MGHGTITYPIVNTGKERGNGKWKVRFNLGRGCNYKTWKITDPDGNIKYIDPSTVSLTMRLVTLKNKEKAAQEIFNGANKRVCAWVECGNLEITEPEDHSHGKEISYNPRKAPNWEYDGTVNVDGWQYSKLYTTGQKIYLKY